MKGNGMKYKIFLIALLAAMLMAAPAWAQSTNPYALTWLTFANGGSASGGQYAVAATLGQLDNGPLSGGDYTVEGRFGIGGETTATPTAMPTPTPPNRQNQLYLPIVTKK